MDSGNSGSLQSSSGGDEEYDNSSRTAAANSMFASPQLPPPSIFDPLSSYTQNPTMNLNPDMPSSWPRSDMDSVIQHHHPLMMSTPGTMISPPPFQQAAVGSVNSYPATAMTVARNPKKRSRASRRAPTTVLTTDTTNFRAMVQDFTGIPAPPFSNSPTIFPRTTTAARLDHLFTGTRSTDPPFLRRPLTQKVQSPAHPFLSTSSSSFLTSTAVSNSPITANNNSNSAPSSNYQLPIHQNSNLFNTQFPFPQINSKFLNPTSKLPDIPLVSSLGFPSTDQFDDGGGSMIGLQNFIPRDQNAVDWRNNLIAQDESEGFQTSSFTGLILETSGLHSGKGSENVAAVRDEGTLDSWIFSSD